MSLFSIKCEIMDYGHVFVFLDEAWMGMSKVEILYSGV